MLDPALISYVAVMSITPGPNNMMLATSGVQFGMRRTLPHVFGISVGLGILVFLISALLAFALALLGVVRLPLALAGCLYLLWLSWQIARAARPDGATEARPMGFVGAALFQWLNPKVWVMVINIAVLFMPSANGMSLASALLLAGLCALINLPCIGVWALAGDRLRHALASRRGLMLFNLTMALFMAGTALWLMVDELRPHLV
jgi:threonine/homoserine/homoserine lactone efflux protein